MENGISELNLTKATVINLLLCHFTPTKSQSSIPLIRILSPFQGYGVKFYSEGEYYEGEWAWGKRNGWGRMYYKDGAIYEGQWSEDKPGGQGMFRCSKCPTQLH